MTTEQSLIKLHTIENPDPEPTEWIDEEAIIADAPASLVTSDE